MKIAVSADCFSAFTSGTPVRGMMKELIRMRRNDQFTLFYVNRPLNKLLTEFYNEINSFPNVEVKFLKENRRIIGIKKMFHNSSYLKLDFAKYDLFISPGDPEFISGFNRPQLSFIADLSTIKNRGTGTSLRIFKYFFYYRLKYVLKKSDYLIAISENTKKDIEELFPWGSKKIKRIYNGIEDVWFNSEYAENEIVSHYAKESYWVWWGHISRRKNIERLLDAYEELSTEKKIPDLLLIGNLAKHQEHLKSRLKGKIKLIPFQDILTLKTLVKNSKGLLFPSLFEGFGLPVIEAFSQGVPVLHSNNTSLPEIGGGLGIECDPYKTQLIKHALEAILELKVTNELIEKLKARANQFTYFSAAQKVSELIDTI